MIPFLHSANISNLQLRSHFKPPGKLFLLHRKCDFSEILLKSTFKIHHWHLIQKYYKLVIFNHRNGVWKGLPKCPTFCLKQDYQLSSEKKHFFPLQNVKWCSRGFTLHLVIGPSELVAVMPLMRVICRLPTSTSPTVSAGTRWNSYFSNGTETNIVLP